MYHVMVLRKMYATISTVQASIESYLWTNASTNGCEAQAWWPLSPWTAEDAQELQLLSDRRKISTETMARSLNRLSIQQIQTIVAIVPVMKIVVNLASVPHTLVNNCKNLHVVQGCFVLAESCFRLALFKTQMTDWGLVHDSKLDLILSASPL